MGITWNYYHYLYVSISWDMGLLYFSLQDTKQVYGYYPNNADIY